MKKFTNLKKRRLIGYSILGLVLLVILNVVFFLVMIPFLTTADNLPFEDAARIGEANLWRIVFLYALFTLIFLFVSFLRKFFRGVAIVLVIFWIMGTSLVYFINSSDDVGVNEASRGNVISDRSSCKEEDAVDLAKQCTILIVRNDGGHGSGFSITPGYAVTNKHVIEGASKLTTWIDGEKDLIMWNYSPTYDVAVVKLPVELPSCKWFDSSRMQTAENLYAVGWPNSPAGDSTVTKGIYSRINKFEDGLEFIQTDAPINPGNSGGPLVNKCGVVGINTLKESWSSNDIPLEGLGNALSSSSLVSLVDQLIKEGGNSDIPKSQTTYQSIDPNVPDNTTVINEVDVIEHLARIRAALNSWRNTDGRYSQEDLNKLRDLFIRQIQFSETLLSRIQGGKRPSQDDLFMWDSIVKMSYESAAIAQRLNSNR